VSVLLRMRDTQRWSGRACGDGRRPVHIGVAAAVRAAQATARVLACAAVLASLILPVGAATSGAQGLRPVSDVRGRFTISFPADWEVHRKSDGIPAVFAFSPVAEDHTRANVNVVVEDLEGARLSSADYGKHSGRVLAMLFHNYTLLQEGPAKIAGLPSYYRYFTWETNNGWRIYQVQAYFVAGGLGFVVTGSTGNDPARIRRDMPLIGRIFETFRPAVAAGSKK
jgi:hypothetical protein